jgi:serine-type D-Ala-D-Ala carboxypeptidase (penicillin-binding protein 5/6)
MIEVTRLAGALLAAALVASGLAPPAAAARHAAAAKPVAAAPAMPAPAAPTIAAQGVGIDTQALHAFVIETETGTVLLDKGAEERIPPASMSKMMTAYVVFTMLKEGRAKLTDELPVSEAAWRLQGSKMFVPLGGRVSISDLLHGVIVQSGNDACLVLAQGLAGSEQAFVDLMNQTAKKIGLKNSHFANVDGLPNPDHWMTARDLATLAWRTMKDFPEYYKIYSDLSFTFNNIKQGNRNPLLYDNIGADGLKTGHTEESGYSLTASVKRGDRRIIMVLNGMPSMRARAQESERVADWAFREFSDYKLFKAGDKVADAEVWLGTEPKVPLTVSKDFIVTLSRQARSNMKVTVDYAAPIAAPVKKGESVGKLVVTAPGMVPAEAPLVAAADVGRMGPLGRIAATAGSWIWGRH